MSKSIAAVITKYTKTAAADKVKWTFESSLAVEDYIDPDDETGDTGYAFDDSENDHGAVEKVVLQDLKDILKGDARKVKIVDTTFLEHDSGNWTHANAMFEVELEGPQDLITKFEKEYFGE